VRRIYLALGVYVGVFLLGEAWLGRALRTGALDPSWRRLHLIAGVGLAIFVCLVQSLVFIHLLGTGLGVKRAIDEHGLDGTPRSDLHRFKMRAFPPAFLCIVAAIATAVTGGAALAGAATSVPHLALAGLSVVLNAVTFPVVARALGENEVLMRRVEATIAAKAKR